MERTEKLKKIFRANQFHQNPLIKLPLAFLLVLILPILSITFIIPMLIIRSLVKYSATIFRPDLAEILIPASNNIANCSPDPQNPRLTIVLTKIHRGKISLETARQTFLKMVNAIGPDSQMQYPEYSQYVTSYMGYRFWAPDPHFDISNHVMLAGKIKPVMFQDDICDIQQHLMLKPFYSKRSPWDVTVVNNVCTNTDSKTPPTTDLNTALIYRFSHALLDGYSIIKMGESYQTITKDVKIEPKYTKVGLLQRIAFPFKCLYVTAELILSCLTNSPFKVPWNKRTFMDYVQSAEEEDVKIIKEIKNSCNVSFMGAILSLATGAFRSMAIRSRMDLPKTVSCVIPLPLPGHPSKLTNHFTLAALNLPVGEPDPMKRVRLCHQEYERIRSSAYPTVANLSVQLFGSCFKFIGEIAGKHHPGDLFISYVPIEYKKALFAGHELISMSFCSPQSGCKGCGIFITTLADRLAINVVAESGIFTKEQTLEFRSIIKDEINILRNMKRNIKQN